MNEAMREHFDDALTQIAAGIAGLQEAIRGYEGEGFATDCHNGGATDPGQPSWIPTLPDGSVDRDVLKALAVERGVEFKPKTSTKKLLELVEKAGPEFAELGKEDALRAIKKYASLINAHGKNSVEFFQTNVLGKYLPNTPSESRLLSMVDPEAYGEIVEAMRIEAEGE